MYNHKWFIYLFTLWLSHQIVCGETENFATACPTGWVQRTVSCFQYNSASVSRQQAAQSCERHGAHLVFIEDVDENNFVQGFLGEPVTSLWIGARRVRWLGWCWTNSDGSSGETKTKIKRKTAKWESSTNTAEDRKERVCAVMSENGLWGREVCSAEHSFLCEQPLPCKTGWFSTNCDKPCHCYQSEPCSRETGVCPNGCDPGWTGDSCSKENPMPDASFHCLRTSDNGLRADVTVHTMQRQYGMIQAVDEEGQRLPCSPESLQSRSEGNVLFVSLFLPDAFVSDTNEAENETTSSAPSDSAGTDAPESVTADTGYGTESGQSDSCVASRSENGTVTWLIELKRYRDIRTGDDVTVEVTCELDEADSMETTGRVVDESAEEEPVSLTAVQKEVNVSVYLTNSFTGERCDTFHFGLMLNLNVVVEGLTDHECAVPHSCVVKPQGTQKKPFAILDKDGCPVEGTPLSRLSRGQQKGHFQSSAFPAFSLGSSPVLIDCQVDVEYQGDTQGCERTCPQGAGKSDDDVDAEKQDV